MCIWVERIWYFVFMTAILEYTARFEALQKIYQHMNYFSLEILWRKLTHIEKAKQNYFSCTVSFGVYN